MSPRVRVTAVLLAVQLAFASLAIVGKVTLGAVPWPAMMAARTLGALFVFVVAALVLREPMLPPPGLRLRAVVLGFLGVFANQSAYLAGLRRTSAINATVLLATIPLFTALVSVLSGREPWRPRFAAGSLVALAGLMVVVRVERLTVAPEHLTGDALVVLNSMVYGLYLALARDIVLKHGALALVRWVFAGGALFAVPVGLPTLITSMPTFSPRVAGALAYVVVVPTAFAYAANAWALQRVPSSVVSVFVYLQPILAAALALSIGPPLARWLHVVIPAEGLTLRTVAGAATVLVGVAIATAKGRPRSIAGTIIDRG